MLGCYPNDWPLTRPEDGPVTLVSERQVNRLGLAQETPHLFQPSHRVTLDTGSVHGTRSLRNWECRRAQDPSRGPVPHRPHGESRHQVGRAHRPIRGWNPSRHGGVCRPERGLCCRRHRGRPPIPDDLGSVLARCWTLSRVVRAVCGRHESPASCGDLVVSASTDAVQTWLSSRYRWTSWMLSDLPPILDIYGVTAEVLGFPVGE